MTEMSGPAPRPGRRALLALGGALPAAPALAQGWQPDRRIELWVAFAPGGAADVLARSIAEQIERARGWTMVVVNRTGGAGVVMANALRAAPATGTTLGVTVNAAFAAPAVTQSPPPYTLDDFAYVARLARAELALTVRADAPWPDIAAFAAHARTKGGASVAVQGPEVELGVRALARHLGVPLEPIPVRGGAEGMTQLLGGHIDAAVLAGVQTGAVREGRLRELLSFGAHPLVSTPGAPTLRSLGLDVVIEPVFQVIAPRGTPEAALAAHAEAISAALRTPSLGQVVTTRLSLVQDFAGPAETEARTRAESTQLARLAAEFRR